MKYNLDELDFDSFITFLFDHNVADRDSGREPWYWAYDLKIDFDPVRTLSLYTRLFNNPEFLLENYSHEQLEQGFWAIHGCNLDCSVSEIILDFDVALVPKEECIKSMYFLYEKLFSKNPLDTSSFMWWDSLAYDYCCGNLFRERSEAEQVIQDVMFETLCKILYLNSDACQVAALHGLGHLRHPDTERAIKAYIYAHPEIDDDTREYALACITGDIQ